MSKCFEKLVGKMGANMWITKKAVFYMCKKEAVRDE